MGEKEERIGDDSLSRRMRYFRQFPAQILPADEFP